MLDGGGDVVIFVFRVIVFLKFIEFDFFDIFREMVGFFVIVLK